MRLVDRDYQVLKEIDRWRVCLSRHIRILGNFPSQSTCDRRLKKLQEAGYIYKKKILYGIPSLYFLTHKGKVLVHVSTNKGAVKVEQIVHDITVLETAIYLHLKEQISFQNMTTDKELHSIDGFSNRKHHPDFIYRQDNKTTCVEIELTQKAKSRLSNNIKANYLNYDEQVWIVPTNTPIIRKTLEYQSQLYTNIRIISVDEVNAYVKSNT